jgi:sporulation protein YlmC with PRC-barrel domain
MKLKGTMKRKYYLALSTAVGAICWAGVAPVTYAADTSANIGIETRNDKTLGNVERANKLIGKAVYTSDNQKVGKLDNLIVDLETGRILYGIVSTGTLGVGGHDYAVAPGAFTDARGDTLHLNIDKAKLTGAPEFSSNVDKPEQLAQATFVNQVYQYFGQNAWWQGGNNAADSGTFHNVHKANDVIGMKVKNVNNEDLGKVDNLVVNLPTGRVPYVILNPDSSLKLGNNYYALPPNALTWNSDQKNLVSDLNHDKLAGAPHFSKEQWQTVSDPAFGTRVYEYYGKQAYFEGGRALQPTGTERGKVYPNK